MDALPFLPFVRVCLKSLRKKPFDFELKTLGKQIKKRRLEFGLSQIEVGKVLGVDTNTILNWEKGYTESLVISIPAIPQFLGFYPFPKPKIIPERLMALRRSNGWSIRGAAKEFGVDFGTWRDWECGKTILFLRHRELVAGLLGLNIEEVHNQMSIQGNGHI